MSLEGEWTLLPLGGAGGPPRPGARATGLGAQGRAVDRAEAWHTAHPEPLRPERIDPAAKADDMAAQVRLRRARMRAWSLLGGEQVGPMSELLDPRRPRWLDEEQVPKAGVRVERAWQLGRWHDGGLHLWLSWRTSPGRGEAASGVRWDILDRQD